MSFTSTMRKLTDCQLNMKYTKSRSGSRINVLQYMSTPIGMGGLEYYVLTLCEHLDRNQFQPMITGPNPERKELAERTTAAHIPLFGFPTKNHSAFAYVIRTIALAFIMRRRRVDVLHVHATGYSGLNAFIAAYLAGVPRIVLSHHTVFPLKRYRFSEKVLLWLQTRPRTTVVAFFNQFVQNLATIGFNPAQMVVVPTGVDLRKFEYDPTSTERDPSVFKLVITARFQDGKGHDVLLSALAQLRDRFPNLRLLVIGDGEMRPQIEAQIAALGLADIVELAGWVANEQMAAKIRAGNVFVLPTYIPTENFPISIVEGMAMGLPAIGARMGGIPDIIEDGETGFVVEPKDVDSLTAAIERLVSNPQAAADMGRKARLRVEQRFSAQVMADAIGAVYAGQPVPAYERNTSDASSTLFLAKQ